MKKNIKDSGFTILEVMIALLILSSALLGFAAMQLRGLTMNKSSLLRSEAVYRVYEMADRMRANLSATYAGNYNNPTPPTSLPGCYPGTACTPANMATADYVEWNQVNAAVLPNGQGVVCLTSVDPGTAASAPTPTSPQCNGSGNIYAIMVWWTDDPKSTNLKMFYTLVRP